MEREVYRDLMEDNLENSLLDLKTLEFGSKEHEAAMKEIDLLATKILAYDQERMEFEDKTKRREAEQKRNEAMVEIEKKKLHMPIERILIAVAEIGLPMIFASALIPYMANYEKENRICSSIGREIWNLPKIFIKKYR